MAPAEQMARFGVPASRALVRDLNVVAGPLAADPAARAVFFPDGHPLAEGAQLLQPELGGTLAQLRTAGVGDLYQGALAHLVADAARDAGGGLTAEDLRRALAAYATPLSTPTGHDIATFLPPPADGGLAADAAFRVLEHDPSATAAAQARALAVAAPGGRAGVIRRRSSAPPTCRAAACRRFRPRPASRRSIATATRWSAPSP